VALGTGGAAEAARSTDPAIVRQGQAEDDPEPVGGDGGAHDRALAAYKAKLGRNDKSKPRAAVECFNSMFKRTQKPFLRAKDAQHRECEAR
jgi:hypothetical protein